MRIDRIKNIEAERRRRAFKINFHVNDDRHVHERRSERQMMNRIN